MTQQSKRPRAMARISLAELHQGPLHRGCADRNGGGRGEVRPTHTPKTRKYRTRVPHTWRTRPDPFEVVWSLILDWLQKQPDVGAPELMDRLIRRYPDRYSRSQLRTLQRRVRQWRGVMTNKLVYASAEHSEIDEERLGNIRPVGGN